MDSLPLRNSELLQQSGLVRSEEDLLVDGKQAAISLDMLGCVQRRNPTEWGILVARALDDLDVGRGSEDEQFVSEFLNPDGSLRSEYHKLMLAGLRKGLGTDEKDYKSYHFEAPLDLTSPLAQVHMQRIQEARKREQAEEEGRTPGPQSWEVN